MEEAADDDDASEPDESVDDAHPLPDAARKPNPLITALYGQMCVSAKSFQSAICGLLCLSLLRLLMVQCGCSTTVYLLYAYELCPDDPVICLSLVVASIGRAMQRQSDNRHHLIAQVGRAFHSRNISLIDRLSRQWRSSPATANSARNSPTAWARLTLILAGLSTN
jgi:general transcription factor 3C polypeptide 3 (transcription factor C subunit 4)